MKGDKKRRAGGFKTEHPAYYKKSKTDYAETLNNQNSHLRTFMRTSKSKLEFIKNNTDNGLLHSDSNPEPELPYINGERVDFTALRPKSDTSATKPPVEVQDDGNTNIIVNRNRMCYMWNNALSKHHKKHPCCTYGELVWNEERSMQWGLSWKAVLSCTNCSYISDVYKLYEEVENGITFGPKPATVTYGTQVGLSKNGISNGGLIEILTAANIRPPSYSTLQRAANVVGEAITEANVGDMRDQCTKLRDLNKATGKPYHGPIPAEADGTYNNAIYSKVGKSPFQAATQVDFTVSENLTPEKKIIALVSHSKLCSCPKNKEHLTDCSATLTPESTIGNEGEYLIEAIETINDNGLDIGELTVDGDSSSRSEAPQIDQPSGVKIIIKYCTWHLKRVLERKIKGHNFSKEMFKGRNKIERDQAHSRFTYDISNRVSAEFEAAHKLYDGDIDKIHQKMPDIMEAIIDCYRGNCQNCLEHSFVCTKTNSWSRPFLDINHKDQREFMIKATGDDLNFMREAMNVRLGKEALEKTSNNSTQNKSEANNKGIKKPKPKQLTFSKNYSMRSHSAVHSMNNGAGSSLVTLCAATGAPIRGKSLYKQAERLDKKKRYHQNRQKTKKYLISRRSKRQENYAKWDLKRDKERPGYIKGAGAEELIYNPPKHEKMDHSYMSNKSTVILNK